MDLQHYSKVQRALIYIYMCVCVCVCVTIVVMVLMGAMSSLPLRQMLVITLPTRKEDFVLRRQNVSFLFFFLHLLLHTYSERDEQQTRWLLHISKKG